MPFGNIWGIRGLRAARPQAAKQSPGEESPLHEIQGEVDGDDDGQVEGAEQRSGEGEIFSAEAALISHQQRNHAENEADRGEHAAERLPPKDDAGEEPEGDGGNGDAANGGRVRGSNTGRGKRR